MPVLFVILIILFWARPWYGPDIWLHILWGKNAVETLSLTPPELTVVSKEGFFNFYWLFQVLVQAVYRVLGEAGVSLWFAGLCVGTAAFWRAMIKPERAPLVGWPLAALSLVVWSGRFEERPEIWSYLFLCAQLFVLVRWSSQERAISRREWIFFGVTQVLWSNMHGLFLFGPAMSGLLALCLFFEKNHSGARRAAVLSATLILLSMISPFGWLNWGVVIGQWNLMGTLKSDVAEFAAPLGPYLRSAPVFGVWIYAAATLIAGVWLSLRARGGAGFLFALSLAAVGIYLGTGAVKNIPLAVLLGAPLWARLIDRAPPRLSYRWAGEIIALGIVIWGMQSAEVIQRIGFGVARHAHPVDFVEHLKSHPFRGKVFNHPSDGNYILFFTKGITPYGDSFWIDPRVVREYYQALANPDFFRVLDARERFDSVLVSLETSTALMVFLLTQPEWSLAYADLWRAFFVRTKTAASPAFYSGQDLSQKANGIAAIRWVSALAMAQRSDLMLEALKQFSRAPVVPAPALSNALLYLIPRADQKLLELVVAMRPRMLALSTREAQAVDELLAQTPAGAKRP